MASITLDHASVAFPILHLGHRSLKKSLVSTMTGGAIIREAHKPPYVRALNDVSAHFVAGDRVGLIGPNGAGKTTLLRLIGGIYEPVSGHVRTQGRVATLLDTSLGFSPDMTGRENIRLCGMYAGIKPSQMQALTAEIEAFTELGDYLNMPIRTYSSGMQMRLAFAVVTSVHADILLMDEWVMAGDAAFLAKARRRMDDLVARASILVLASHSDAIIREWCNKAIYLCAGEVEYVGDVDAALDRYRARVAARA